MNFKVHCVYKLTCPVSGEIKYIGQTQNPSKRRTEHRNYTEKHGNNKLAHYKRFLKSKNERFLFDIILCTKFKDEADYWEIYLIANTPNLLNLAKGGSNIITENHISNKLRGKSIQDVHGEPAAKYIKYRLSKAFSGSGNPNYKGVNCTKTWRINQSVSQSKHPVLVLDTFTGVYNEYLNSKTTASELGCSASNIRMCKDGNHKVRGRFLIMSLY